MDKLFNDINFVLNNYSYIEDNFNFKICDNIDKNQIIKKLLDDTDIKPISPIKPVEHAYDDPKTENIRNLYYYVDYKKNYHKNNEKPYNMPEGINVKIFDEKSKKVVECRSPLKNLPHKDS